MELDQIIQTYGYLAVLIGTFLEGETILVLAGFVAYNGDLELFTVILAAFLGSTAGDQFYFYLGRWKGNAIIHRFRPLSKNYPKANYFIERYQTYVVLFSRFLYGMRILLPLACGVSSIPPLKFFLLNILSAAVWATIFAGLGYLFGTTAELFLGKIHRYERTIVVLVIAVAVVLWLIHFLRERRKGQRANQKAS